MKRFIPASAAVAFALACLPAIAAAQSAGSGDGAAPAPAAYAAFTKGQTPQRGLFTIWRKDGKVYLDLAKSQLDTDFIQTAVPANGIGGFGITPGVPYLSFPSARIVRFARVDNKVVVTWPNTAFIAPDGSAASRAIAASFAPSVIATAAVAAADADHVVVDASYLLGDLLDITDALAQSFGTDKKPQSAYKLDDSRTYFGPTKAFPENVIVEVDQTWASGSPPAAMDTSTDARAIQIAVKYNIAQAPAAGTYVPRVADDRVGYYPNIQLEFGNDRVRQRQVHEIVRWNIARHPMTYYISNTVPEQYRDAIRQALLTWNQAFAPIGYPNAVVVKDQPADADWDADDIRYNTVHWLTQAYNGGYAQAGLVWDPRTGEMVHASIVIDADLMQFGYIEGADWTQPTRNATGEAAYATGAKASATFGLAALQATGDIATGDVPPHYAEDFLRSIVLHESGHNWGLQHNFIASEAYTADQIRSKGFTSRYGLANSVMEYTPTNVWPKGMSKGDYFQTVLGPYDYYAIKYGYAPIAGATTPDQERPALLRLASAWSDPRYRFAMDEDVQWQNGHAIDPRINQWDLTSDNVGWCESQLKLVNTVVRGISSRYRRPGETHEPMRQAFYYTLFPYASCMNVAWHYIGGEDLSRAHIGDPNAQPPLVPVSRQAAQRAFAMLAAHLFSPAAWNVSPGLLREMIYTEWVTDLPSPTWAYNPPLRHDVPISTILEGLQVRTLSQLFMPTMLQRLDDLPLKYSHGSTMSIEDAFAWTQAAVFGDIRNGRVANVGEVHRSLQQSYARMLAQMVVAPQPGTPYDAQSLARAELVSLRGDVKAAEKSHLDALTSAHLEALAAVADQALSARMEIPMAPAPSADGS